MSHYGGWNRHHLLPSGQPYECFLPQRRREGCGHRTRPREPNWCRKQAFQAVPAGGAIVQGQADLALVLHHSPGYDRQRCCVQLL